MGRSADYGPTSPFPRLGQLNVVLSMSSLDLWRQLTKIQMLKQSIPTPIGRSGQAARVPGRMWWSRRCCCKGQDFDWSHSLDDGSVLPCACLPCACLGPLPKRLWPPLPFIQLGHVIPTDGPALESIRRFRRSLHARFHSRRLFAAACFNAITIRGLGRACKRPVDHDMKRMLRAAAGFADLISRLVDV